MNGWGAFEESTKQKTFCEPRVSAHRLNLNLSPRLNRSPQSVASRNCHESVSRNRQSSISRLEAQVPVIVLADRHGRLRRLPAAWGVDRPLELRR